MAAIRGYKTSEHTKKLHAERAKGNPPKPRYNGVGEAEVVPGFQLAAHLQRWRDKWLSERPNVSIKGIHHGATYYGWRNYLARETGINERRVQGLVKGEFQFVSLSQADKILSVTDGTHLLHTGEIQVVPNPNWSTERWVDYMRKRGC